MPENKDRIINIRLDADLMDQINNIASASNITKSDAVRRMIEYSLRMKKASGEYIIHNEHKRMIKDGRPYTYSQEGKDDGALITDLPQTDLKKVANWIQKEIRHDDKIYASSSYSLKHTLHREIGVYLTDNQFKDAMFLAGYFPVRYDEFHWHYQIALTRYDINITNPFYKWLKDSYANMDSEENDLIKDIERDVEFPIFADKEIIKNHIINQCFRLGGGDCNEVLALIDMLWDEYEEYRNTYYAYT